MIETHRHSEQLAMAKQAKSAPAAFAATLLAAVQGALAAGGLATDGTLGQALSLSGANLTIPQSLGRTVGANLFHSFSAFNVATGQTVTFTENVPNALDNVIARVTGGSRSDIDGLLRSTPGGHADFYLINPSGVAFGPNAQVDVPAAFHVSTADQLKLKDDATFGAVDPNASSLSGAAPAAFGFLGTSSANNGLIEANGAKLAVQEGHTLDIVAGAIKLENGAELRAPAGRIRLEAAGAGAAEIPLSVNSTSSHGDLAIVSSVVDASGDGGGKILAQGGKVSISHSDLFANNMGTTDASPEKGIELRADNLMVKNESRVRANVFGQGQGDDIIVAVSNRFEILDSTLRSAVIAGATGYGGNIEISSESLVADSANGKETSINTVVQPDASGSAGLVDIKVSGDLKLNNGAYIGSITVGTGDTGAVNIFARNVSLDFGASIISSSYQNDAGTTAGDAGDVMIEASGNILLQNDSSIEAAVHPTENADAIGKAGHVSIRAASNIAIQNDSVIFTTADANADHANSGNVEIYSEGSLRFLSGGMVYTASFGQDKGGDIVVKADAITLDSQGKSVTGIQTFSFAAGNSGSVTVETSGRLELLNSWIVSTALGNGNTGDMNVQAGSIAMDGMDGSSFTSIWTQTHGSGQAGNVKLESDGALAIANGAIIGSLPDGSGDGGNVSVSSGTLNIYNDRPQTGQTGILAGPANCFIATLCGTGKAGNLEVNVTGAVNIFAGGTISNLTFGNQDAGSVTIEAGYLNIKGDEEQTFTGIFANTGGAGRGGNVDVKSAGIIDLIDGGRIETTSFPGASGNAGDITVNAGRIRLVGGRIDDFSGSKFFDSSGIFAESQGAGNGGAIKATSDGGISMFQGGRIEVSSFGLGSAGDIIVKAKTIQIDGGGSEQIGKSKSFLPSGVFADAGGLSAGKTGQINISADNSIRLSGGGAISIQNKGNAPDPTLAESGALSVSAAEISLNRGLITTLSTGNVAAGAIALNGAQVIDLRDSAIVTTSKGENSDGGDIRIQAGALIMDTGLIQANANGGFGGDILIDAHALIPSGNMLSLGGATQIDWTPGVFGFNVIQAASKAHASGTITSTAPQLNLSGVLANFGAPSFDIGAIAQDYCALSEGSSLVRQGKGGLPVKRGDSFLYFMSP
jgi:filamentous hemagglutinin family protein